MHGTTNTATLPIPLDRVIYFSEQVNQASIRAVMEKVLLVNDNDKYLVRLYALHDLIYIPKPIKIYIDSYGGAVYQCLAMDNSETPIHTFVTGAAMSCGFMILIHGHRRFAFKHATPLYHQVSSGVQGTAKAIEEKLMETKRLQKKLEDLTLSKTKIGKAKLKEIYEKKIDWFMSAEEAKKLGVVDEIL